MIAERSHQVAGDDQRPAPDGQVDPFAGRERQALTAEELGVELREQADEQHGGKRGQRRVPSSVEIGRNDRRHRVKAEHDALRRNQRIEDAGQCEEPEHEPQFFVDPLQAPHDPSGDGGVCGAIGRGIRGLSRTRP